MTKNWEQLEGEVDAGIAAMGDALDVELPSETQEQARLATRVAFDEHWFESQAAAEVSPAVRTRVMAAVRRELTGQSARSTRNAWLKRHVRGLSALASAAMIGICIGVIHQAGRFTRVGPEPALDPSIEQFVQVGDELYEMDPLTTDLTDDLRNLEESIAQWPTETDRLEDGLQQIDEMIDGLQLESNESGTL